MRHICLYAPHASHLVSPYLYIQVQPNGNDCGLFAIAFAMIISSGQTHEDLLFDMEQMRSHLTSCFEKRR